MRLNSILIVASLFLSSCWSNPKPENEIIQYSLDDAQIEENVKRYEKELSIIDSLSTLWSWSPDSITGGILLQRYNSANPLNNVGDTVMLSVDVNLVNGNHCFTNDSLYVVVDHYNGPKAFNSIARNIGVGDSCSVLVPSDLGFGVKGIPGVVPPGAMLLIHANQPRD